jgi:hypothetical protein
VETSYPCAVKDGIKNINVKYKMALEGYKNDVCVLMSNCYKTHVELGVWDELHLDCDPAIDFDRDQCKRFFDKTIKTLNENGGVIEDGMMEGDDGEETQEPSKKSSKKTAAELRRRKLKLKFVLKLLLLMKMRWMKQKMKLKMKKLQNLLKKKR